MDTDTGIVRKKQVVGTITGSGLKSLVDISIDATGPGGDRRAGGMTATDGHPIYSSSNGRWEAAGSLQPGEYLATASDSSAIVNIVTHYSKSMTVYNLSVADFHTYFVVTANVPILVHNCPGEPDVSGVPTVRMRHYTNSKGKAGILESGVLKASDQNKVFMVQAKGRLMSPVDAARKLGIGRGRGRHVVDFDAPESRVYSRYNSTMNITEWVADGDLAVSNIKVMR